MRTLCQDIVGRLSECVPVPVCNFSMLVLAILEYNNPEVGQKPKKAVD